MPRKLEIGPGGLRLDKDWETLDCKPGSDIDHVSTWGFDPLPFTDSSFSIIYASHVLEHVPWFQIDFALKEARRILEIDGRLEVWVPDFSKIVESYLQKSCGDFWRKYNPNDDFMVWVNGRIFTYGPDPNWHRTVFDAPYLHQCLKHAGFQDVFENKDRPRGHDHGPINLGMVAIK